MYQNNTLSSVSHFLHIKRPGNNLNISRNYNEKIYAIISNTLTDWILTFCFIARECRWHAATFWQTLTINIQNCTEGWHYNYTLPQEAISRLKIKTLSTHWVFVIRWGKGHHFPASDKWRGILPTNATKRLCFDETFIMYIINVFCLYLLQSLNQIHDVRQNGDKLSRQRRLCGEFVSRLSWKE